jgi:outer membrane protein OmpA-like peptidoglycan-associated protein
VTVRACVRLALFTVLLSPLALDAQTSRIGFAKDMQLAYVNSLGQEPDYEAILTILRSDSAEGAVRFSWNRGSTRQWKFYERVVSARERRLARSFYYFASENDARQFRGTTPAMLSTALLGDIKSGGSADAVVLMPATTSRPFRGQLRATGTSPFTLLIDGRRATVPALKVAGTFTGDMPLAVSMLVLDDPAAPWILRSDSPRNSDWRGGIVQLVRVETRVRSDELANALRDECRATVRNIYFATGSDAIDTTSTPAIGAIAAVLKANPSWRVTIEGHTDSIGAKEVNQELSERRAVRVVTALREEHGIPAAHLSAKGKGETELMGDNGTAEGRAASRRVALVRDCAAGKARQEPT